MLSELVLRLISLLLTFPQLHITLDSPLLCLTRRRDRAPIFLSLNILEEQKTARCEGREHNLMIEVWAEVLEEGGSYLRREFCSVNDEGN